MKKLASVVLVLSMILGSGCATSGGNTGPGILLGSVLGAGAGAIIGHQTGNAEGGALIGAGLGGLAGGLVGGALDSMEEEREAEMAQHEAQTAAAFRELSYVEGQLSILDVIRMSQAGVSDSIIVAKIDQSRSYFELSAEEIIDLRLSGVSDPVIEHILWRGRPSQVATAPAQARFERGYSSDSPPPALGIQLGFNGCR